MAIEIRGRNGWFKYDGTQVIGSTSNPGETWVNIYSKRSGATAPVVINGPADEVVTVLTKIIETIKQETKEA